MSEFNVAETFVSINGEGIKAGELAFFVRLGGCNLDCSYCDTKWARAKENNNYKKKTEKEIYEEIKKSNIKNVTLTGGEPLAHENIIDLLEKLSSDKAIVVEIETNGSIDLSYFSNIDNRPGYTMDYKLPGSDMEKYMIMENFNYLTKKDTIKFVISDEIDLNRAYDIIIKYNLTKKCNVYLSPVFGSIEPAEIVEFMKEKLLNEVKLQIQMHKVIWDPEKRGV